MTTTPYNQDELYKLLMGDITAKQERRKNAESQYGLAQRLRDERVGVASDIGKKYQDLYQGDTDTYGGTPVDRFDRGTAFMRAMAGIVNPATEEMKLAQDAITGNDSSGDLLSLLGLAQKSEEAGMAKIEPPTYAEKREADKSGKVYEQMEDGSWGMRDKDFEELSDEEKKSYMQTYDQLGVILGSGYDKAKQNLKGSYGGLRLANTPVLNTFMKGDTRNAKSALQNILSKYELDASGQMKGQGQVSNIERQIIAKAATELSNPEMSEDRAVQLLMEMEMALANKAGLESKYASTYAKKYGANAVTSSMGYESVLTDPNDFKSIVDKYWE